MKASQGAVSVAKSMIRELVERAADIKEPLGFHTLGLMNGCFMKLTTEHCMCRSLWNLKRVGYAKDPKEKREALDQIARISA